MNEAASITLILADDHGIVREGIAAFCKSRPEISIVGECGDGERVLEMIFEKVPDFAVLDLNMPKLGGLDVLHKVRAAHCPTKIIILSICRDENIIREVLRSGADGYVLKDGPARYLFDAISYIQDGGQYITPLLKFGEQPKFGSTDPLSKLSKREYEVYAYLVDGLRPRDVAKLLDISPKTVDTYRAGIMRKLRVDGIAELVRFAVERKPR